jgi:hypothetical protein
MASQLGRREIGDEQHVRTDGIGRLPTAPEIVVPQSEGPAGSELARHQTNGSWPFACRSRELEIDKPNLPVGVQAPAGRHESSLPSELLENGVIPV